MATATIDELNKRVAGQTAPQLFLNRVNANPTVVALRSMRDDGADGWNEWTFQEYADKVAHAAAGLAAAGVKPGQRVLLMMRNRPDFHWLDTAAQFIRATPVSIYNSSSPEEIQYLAHHSEAEVAIVEDSGFLERILKVRDELPNLKTIYAISGAGEGGSRPADELYQHGGADLAALAAACSPDDVATIIYTSGTTGPPKGVMITQYNVAYTVEQLRLCIDMAPEEMVGLRAVSYLPMAHIAERMMSHYQQLVLGYTVTTCPDPGLIATYAREVHPEIMFGVPRVWEKIYNGVNAVLAADPAKKGPFDDGVAAAMPIAEARRLGTMTKEQEETYAFLDAVAFSTVRGLIGLDSIRVAVTGAAPIPKEVIEWFWAIGVPLSEIYGMSESSGPMTWEPYRVKPGTVGRCIPGMELDLAEDGEVICRGGNIFGGYLKAPDKTVEALQNGWLHTGDIGEIDSEGYLRIVDRKKELIITAGGKNISPANLEAALKTIPLVGQAAAVGDNRRFVCAILVLDPEYAPVWAAQNGISYSSLDELAAHPQVQAEVQKGVDEVNTRFAQVEQIKRFHLSGDEWLPDSDLLTPTSKLKRRGILVRYADALEGIYA